MVVSYKQYKRPSFIRKHNQRRVEVLSVLYIYKLESPAGIGLTLRDIIQALGMGKGDRRKITHVLTRLCRYKEISGFIPPTGKCSRYRHYRILSKGGEWLDRWAWAIPWDDYNFDIEAVTKQIKIILWWRDLTGDKS